MTRHLLGLAAGVLLVAGLGCASDPTESLTGDVAGIETSYSVVQVDVADSVLVTASAKDSQGNSITTLPDVSSLDPTIVSVTVADVPPPLTRRFYIKGLAFGAGRVLVAAGGQSDTILVDTWPATIGITGVAQQLRSRETATVTLTGLDALGNPIAGVTPMTVETDDGAVLALDQNTGVVTALDAGFATLTAYGPVNSEGDTVAEGTFGVRVFANVPASAELSGTTFGGLAIGAEVTLELLVLDAYDNQNVNRAEILSATVNSSNNGVATVAAAVVDTIIDGLPERHIFVTVTGVAAGAVDITGSVTTSEGTLAFGTTPATVLAPDLTSIAVSSGPGATVSLTGSALSATGFPTVVLVNGTRAGNVTVVSAAQVDVRMPSYATTGDYPVVVTVGGVPSDTATWTLTSAFTEDESVNDVPATSQFIGVPFAFAGAFEGAPEEDDFFRFTLSAPATVIIDLGWSPAKDLDILVTTGGFSGFVCTNGATGARPERATCNLAAGTYYLWLNDFDADATGNTTPVTYNVTGRIQ